MATYDLSVGEGQEIPLRIKEVDHGELDETEFDLFQVFQDGTFRLRHGGIPEPIVDFKAAAADAVSNLAATFDGGHTASSGSLLIVGVMADQAGGSRSIQQQTNFNNIGSVLLSGDNRIHLFSKIAQGGEVGSGTWQISGGTAEMIVIVAELPGFNGGFIPDEDEADSGTGTTASLVDATSTNERNCLMLGFVGSRLEAHTAPAPTNSYIEVATIATTSMRATLYYKIVEATGVLDFDVTLDSSVAWVVKAAALTPTFPMFEVDNITQHSLMRSIMLARLDEDPIAPELYPLDNHSRIYVKWQPGASTKSRVLIMHEDGEIMQVPFVREDGPTWQEGDGSPEGSVTAPVGSQYVNKSGGSGTTLYVKESGTGNTGWIGK